jgi:hypothetical protein
MRWRALFMLAMSAWPIIPMALAQTPLQDNISTDAQCAHDILLSVLRNTKFCEAPLLPFDAVIESSLKEIGDYIVENASPPVTRQFLEQRRVEALTNSKNHEDCSGLKVSILQGIRLQQFEVMTSIDKLLSVKRVVHYDPEIHGCFK